MKREPFNPNWAKPIDPFDDTTNKRPQVVVAIGLVGYGYQVDYYIAGQHVGTECRDFGGTYPIPKLEATFADAIAKAIEKTRETL